MENILRSLNTDQVAIDLGCGGGSFNYPNYACRIIAVDLSFNGRRSDDNGRVQYVNADSADIPLAPNSADAVICNHTLEHFSRYRHTLREINRILKPNGMVWIAIPDGFGLDDMLYRLIFRGGGHVNRFTRDGLVRDVLEETGLKLVQTIELYSGFVYLRKPSPAEAAHYPRTAKPLVYLPGMIHYAVSVGINTTTRLMDKICGSRTSRYGWGFVFARHGVELPQLPSYFNVCWKCGCGNDAEDLKRHAGVRSVMGVRMFACAACGEKSVFFEPLPGLR